MVAVASVQLVVVKMIDSDVKALSTLIVIVHEEIAVASVKEELD